MDADLIYWLLIAYFLPIGLYYGLGCDGTLDVEDHHISWDWLIFVPVLNLFGLWLMLKALFS